MGTGVTTNLADYLTVAEAAAVVGVSPDTLRRWDRAGKLTAARHPLNGYRLYRRADLDALVRRVTARPAAPTGPEMKGVSQ